MNPTSTLRLRGATALLAVAWALLALGLEIRGHVSSADLPEPPFTFSSLGNRHVIHSLTPAAKAAGLVPGARLLAVDGFSVEHWLRGDLRLVPGRPNRYAIGLRDGRQIEASLAPRPPGTGRFALARGMRLVLPLVGAVYLAIGVVVWRLRPDRSEAWALLLFSSAMAAELFSTGEPVGRVHWLVASANVPLLGATACHLFSTFPFEPRWIIRRPQLRSVPYLLAGGIVALLIAEMQVGVAQGVAGNLAFFYTLGLGMACIAGIAVQRWVRRRDALVTRSTVMLLGAALAFLPAMATMLVQYFRGTSFPWSVALVGFVFFPVAVGTGIVRGQLFDIRGLARSSVAYGAATLVITGLFASLITFADAVFARVNVNARSPLFSIAFLFFAILLFNPLRSRVQRFVDTYFDRDRAAYRRAVREISEAMVSMLSIPEIVERILIAVTDTMGVEGAQVLLLDEGGSAPELRVAATRGDRGGDWEEGKVFAVPAAHPLCRQLRSRREELTRADFDRQQDPEVREACRDVFDALEAELLVPILYAGDLLGVIAVGRKLSGGNLGADDRQLLRTLANQSAIAIENARAFDEIAQLNESLEARVEQRTEELRGTQAQLLQSEKMRTLGQLVAGVAHELNNPIGYVHANLQLIDQYLERIEAEDLDPAERERLRVAVHKLLLRSREGTFRVKQIVQDLRTFSRTDEAELQQVDLNQEIDRTLTLMESRLGHHIQVERDYGELPPVGCYAGQLNQVFLNLLVNACDAVEGKGTLRIRTRTSADGVRLDFSDDGPGIPPELQERVFEPFFTTKDVGRGTGLGLSLSHGIVERHGGRLHLRSEPGEGTTFTVELPRQARPPAAAQGSGAAKTPA